MPIGKFADFAALKEGLAKRNRKPGAKPIDDMNAYAAGTADKMDPGWREEAAPKAAKTRRLAMLTRAVDRRASFRRPSGMGPMMPMPR